ncbi:MAG TPA: hypothetical protein VIN03_00385 [Roseateles sp.]
MWFIADAAFALAEQEGLTVTGRQDLNRRMGECAGLAADHPHYLRTRNVENKVPTQQPEPGELALGVYPEDVNDWLAACGTPYRWTIEPMRFEIPVRVMEVPPALEGMRADQRVYFIEKVAGRKTEGHMLAADLREQLQEKAARQRDGWFEIEEAAQLLEDAGRGQAGGWRDKFAAAARAGALPMHEPGSLERIEYGRSGRSSDRAVRTFHDLAHVEDLNTWLDANEPRLPFRFDRPAPQTAAEKASTGYQALLPVVERYAEKRVDELPADVAKFISERLSPLPWDSLGASQRREAAHQHDAQHDPALEAYNTYCFELYAKRDELEDEQRKIELMPGASPSEYDLRRKLLADVKKGMDEVDEQLRALDGVTMDQARNFKPEAMGRTTVADAPKEVTYSLGLFERLQPSTEWTASRLSDTDYVGLAEASELASLHAGSRVSINDFLRAGGRGEIRVFARCARAATMKPTRLQDEPIDIPVGSFPTLPMEACKTLALFRRAEWRHFEDWEPNEAFGGQMCSFERWRLPTEAPSMVTVTDDCLVFGRDVHALADASRAGPEVPAPTPGPATPLQRYPAQEAAILAKLVGLGFTPTALPRPKPGKESEAKKAVKEALGYSHDVMKKAWQRLRGAGRIKDA